MPRMTLYAYLAAWSIAIVGTLGSLYFSEIRDLVPCSLCWYQRIAMYPLVLIFPVGILRRDAKLGWYGLPLAVVGLGIALVHLLLQAGVIPESAAPCQAGLSCANIQEVWFGFVTIPLLSAIGFASIVALLGFALYRSRRDTRS